jgi:hypothetical protein
MTYVRRPVLVFDDPYFDFAPPPPLAVYFLPPPPSDFIVLLAPPPPIGLFVLPIPLFVPIPLWCNHPAYLAAPPGNVIFNNIHNTVIINNVTNAVTIKNQNGQIISSKPAFAHAGHSLGAPLPPTLAKAALSQPPGAGAASTTSVQQSSKLPGQHLPGMNGQALPQAPGTSGNAGLPTRSTAAAQKFQSAAHSPASASKLAHRTAPPAQMHHSPGPASTYRPAAAGPVRSFSPPPAAFHPAAAAARRPAPATAKKAGTH